jgi:Carboxypeptidase regulatory-like domain
MWGTVVAALLCLTLAATAGFAKDKKQIKKEYALIYGTVWDAQQHPVAGVPIKIRRADEKRTRWELVSDRNGEFAQRVPPGKMDYVIWADIKTPKGKPKPEIKAHVENDERVDVGLHLTE